MQLLLDMICLQMADTGGLCCLTGSCDHKTCPSNADRHQQVRTDSSRTMCTI